MSWIRWIKPGIVLNRSHIKYRHEPAYYFTRNGRVSHWQGSTRADSVIAPVGSDWWPEQEPADTVVFDKIPQPEDKDPAYPHPTQKPVECMARPMRWSSAAGDWVWEPFGGSGSTLIAAARTHRRCAVVELDPLFCEAIKRRYQSEFGGAVERVSA